MESANLSRDSPYLKTHCAYLAVVDDEQTCSIDRLLTISNLSYKQKSYQLHIVCKKVVDTIYCAFGRTAISKIESEFNELDTVAFWVREER